MKNILRRLLGGDLRLQEALALSQLKNSWTQVAQNNLLHIQPYKYKNKMLYFQAKSAVAGYDTRFFSQLIIDKYKEFCPGIIIREIKIDHTGGMEPDTPEEHKTAERRICPVCGDKYFGGDSICVLCQNKRDAKIDAKITAYLNEAPWARYSDILADFPQTEETRFLRIRLEMQEETLFYLWRKPDEKQAVKYILLKTGLTPDKINDNIIKEQLPKKLHKMIYE
ncbi:protein DUF721 [Candidatus Termititenax spirochaetophilus]|uniref:Protein DUF721 n=1 Tax=Candidatus Termititenax spirochaetophilus TaxID=2218522 RepID=A0A388T6T2_9BACT|nr:protein DUF721 [Candidatus Termititenax spirochaetophilus]